MAEFDRILNFRSHDLGKDSILILTFDDNKIPGIYRKVFPTAFKYAYSSLSCVITILLIDLWSGLVHLGSKVDGCHWALVKSLNKDFHNGQGPTTFKSNTSHCESWSLFTGAIYNAMSRLGFTRAQINSTIDVVVPSSTYTHIKVRTAVLDYNPLFAAYSWIII